MAVSVYYNPGFKKRKILYKSLSGLLFICFCIMPRRKQMRRGGKGRRKQGGRSIPDTAVAYNGPVRMNATVAQTEGKRTVTKVMNQAFEITTSVAGAASGNINFGTPSSTAGWAEEITTWDEYRVLGVSARWLPYNRYNQVLSAAGASVSTTMAVCVDRDSVAGAPAFLDILEYEGVVVHPWGDPFLLPDFKMRGMNEAEWLTTAASGPSRGYLFAIGPTNSSLFSTKIGIFYITWTIQFRGTQ